MKATISLVHISDPSVFGNPLALGYLKTYSDAALGDRVCSRILELPIAASLKDPDRAAAAILSKKPDIVGFSCYLWNIDAVIAVSKALKKKKPSVRIVLGGPDASGRGAAVVRDSGCDILVCGEGELTFAELLERFLSGRPWAGTPGTVCLRGGEPVQGPPRENILDLEKIPSPYLSGIFEGKEYHHWVFETARGCPFKCAFCVWTTKGKPRYFSTARAAAEAAWMAARAPLPQKNSTNSSSQTVFLADQDLLMSGARALKIILAMRSSSKGRSLLWVINSNVNFWTPELAAALNSACFEVNLGVESVNPAILKALGRNPPSLARISAGLALLNKFAPEASLRFQLMLGLPGDSRKGFLASLRWALDACAAAQLNPVAAFVAPARMGDLVKYGFGRPLRAAVEVFHVSVFPGSRFEKDAGGLGITWGKEAPYPVLTAKGLTAGDLDACYEALDAIGEVTRRICGQPLVMYRDNRGV